MDTEAEHCSICLEVLTPSRNPRLLPCAHSFCRGCLESLISTSRTEHNTIYCPECRTQHQIPGRGFPPNRYIKEHPKPPPQPPRSRARGDKICPKHEIRLSLFCTNCDRAVCAFCFDGKCRNQGHKFVDLEDYQKEEKERVKKQIDIGKQLVTDFNEYRTSLREAERRVDESENQGTHDIQQTIEEGTRLLNQTGESLIQQLKQQCAEVRRELQTAQQNVSKSTNYICSKHKYYIYILNSGI